MNQSSNGSEHMPSLSKVPFSMRSTSTNARTFRTNDFMSERQLTVKANQAKKSSKWDLDNTADERP